MEGLRPTPSAAQAARPIRGTPLAAFHRQVARPIAALFMALGVPPSLQSLGLTFLGVAALAGDRWVLRAEGAGLVYLGFLLDRAEAVIWERKGRPPPWNLYLAAAIDHLQDAALYVGLAVASLRPMVDARWVWQPFAPATFLALCAAAVALFLLVRLLETLGSAMLLRQHLLATRRLPGPSALPRHGPVHPVVGRVLGRDEMVLGWCVGVALAQVQLTLVALVSAQVLLFVEAIALFRLRLRDPEVEASRVLGPEYP
ncbi:MAG: hypothetical protein ABR562_06920 [Thermoplasmatota archaeon]